MRYKDFVKIRGAGKCYFREFRRISRVGTTLKKAPYQTLK